MPDQDPEYQEYLEYLEYLKTQKQPKPPGGDVNVAPGAFGRSVSVSGTPQQLREAQQGFGKALPLTGGAIGSLAGGVPGAMAGAAAGSGLESLIKSANNQPISATDAATKAAEEIALSGVGGAIGKGVGGLGRLMTKASSKVLPAAAEKVAKPMLLNEFGRPAMEAVEQSVTPTAKSQIPKELYDLLLNRLPGGRLAATVAKEGADTAGKALQSKTLEEILRSTPRLYSTIEE